MAIEVHVQGGDTHIILKAFEQKAYMDTLAEASNAVAKKFVEENIDKLMSNLDLQGLANLIAIYAAKKLAKSQAE